MNTQSGTSVSGKQTPGSQGFAADKASLSEWLGYLEALHPTEIDLGLDRLRQVAERLDITSLPCKVVTVAGTNGKGSTVALLESVLRAGGYRTGCYTSPHFLHYNERIALDGEPVADELICKAFAQIEQARGDISLTYFEFGTLAAFLVFAEQKPDVAILEVGLGGRLDAVNLIDPDVSVVTTIALDHESWLGSDIEQIGREKAGIFRSGKPAIIGSQQIVSSVRETAEALGCCSIDQLGYQYRWSEADQGWNWQQLNAEGEVTLQYLQLPNVNLPTDNAATVLQVIQHLGLDIAGDALYQGLATAQLTGRMQRLGRFMLDVAHNPHAAEYVAKRLPQVEGKRVALLGMLDDKDIESVLDIMAPHFDAWYLAQLDGPRATDVKRIESHLSALGCDNMRSFENVSSALDGILEETCDQDLVFVFGSFFTVAGVLAEKERLSA
ncbi:bifunctional tetrahydrofolate synthase/dihydrofolate synthase [Oceanospirillum sanctuarii]|uniref:bifunctional tetrahydrofolate synthase/dihydrofolate synthase n=1 Tax=Oceanospirillum sanctuarii TaxID=1434821 RepID=UPI000A3A563D|nr:bifunctional tetrahydrofolate synthase/dihydrofolate synthase [Oceanospirillum sanctuarii]